MAFKEVADLSADNTISLGGTNRKTGKVNPTKAEGYYLGKRKVADNKKKTGFSYIYFFQTPKGNLGVWGKTDLDRKMTAATPGHMVRVTVAGTVPTPNGDMYKFKVEFDDENTIEVNIGNDEAEAAGSDAGFDSGIDGEDAEDDTEEEAPRYTGAAALSASQRQTKVQELLNGKGKSSKN